MAKRMKRVQLPQLDASIAISSLQKTIKMETGCSLKNSCKCTLCSMHTHEPSLTKLSPSQSTRGSDKWLHEILVGLTPSGARTIKLFIPDICFPFSQGLQFYHTDRKQSRVERLSGVTPPKYLLSRLVQMRRQYKSTLQESFQHGLVEAFDSKFIHQQYESMALPHKFNEGTLTTILKANKNQFKNYIIHNDNRYIIGSIQQHNVNVKEPFCRYCYKDGDCEILSQQELEQRLIIKVGENIAYIQSYIKNQKQIEQLYESSYDCQNIDEELYRKTEKQIILLLSGIPKSQFNFRDFDQIQEQSQNLMKISIQDYITLTTYKIIHYLAMASRIFVKSLKLRWMVNDMSNLYLQQVLAYQTSAKPYRKLRYLLPQLNVNADFFRNSKQFIQVRKNMKLQLNPEKKSPHSTKFSAPKNQIIFKITKSNTKGEDSTLSKTIQVVSSNTTRQLMQRNMKKLKPLISFRTNPRKLTKLQKSTAISIDSYQFSQ